MRAIWNGEVIAVSDETEVVEGNHHFPRESIVDEYFTPSSLQTTCPWKGVAGYFDIEVDGAVNPGAAWFYDEPLPAAGHIGGYVAFWKGVVVQD